MVWNDQHPPPSPAGGARVGQWPVSFGAKRAYCCGGVVVVVVVLELELVDDGLEVVVVVSVCC